MCGVRPIEPAMKKMKIPADTSDDSRRSRGVVVVVAAMVGVGACGGWFRFWISATLFLLSCLLWLRLRAFALCAHHLLFAFCSSPVKWQRQRQVGTGNRGDHPVSYLLPPAWVRRPPAGEEIDYRPRPTIFLIAYRPHSDDSELGLAKLAPQ